jgi:hypothetical protein
MYIKCILYKLPVTTFTVIWDIAWFSGDPHGPTLCTYSPGLKDEKKNHSLSREEYTVIPYHFVFLVEPEIMD